VREVLEPSVQEALRRHVAPGAVVYDVGANIGFFSLLAASLVGPTGRVEAFEPMPSSAEAIRANATLNGLDTIRVHQVAVADRSGLQTLLLHSEDSESHLADRGRHRAITGELAVDVIALDEHIENGLVPIPDVIKIDVEGSEIAVIRGLERTLHLRDVTIVCELHETNHEVAHLLTDLGYAFHNLDGTAPVEDAGPVHLLAHRARHQSMLPQ
jgi:FkbM family methyltransferase